jgi:MOSC domain-containing protein YiiM
VRESTPAGAPPRSASESLAACVTAVLELPHDALPAQVLEADSTGFNLSRWLGGHGIGLVPVADVASFSWAGPWIAWVVPAGGGERRAVVMFGVPSGVLWDPSGVTAAPGWSLESGFVLAALDIALARPQAPPAPQGAGTLEAIYVAAEAGAPAQQLTAVRALAGRGLEGDRHTVGRGTFPSGPPGSALTLIAAEVCESFDPWLEATEHRRNLVTRGIDLNALVGRAFTIGSLRCRGVRLCEPCTVVNGYARRPVLRALVHRGGLRADILEDGVIRVGDAVAASQS